MESGGCASYLFTHSLPFCIPAYWYSTWGRYYDYHYPGTVVQYGHMSDTYSGTKILRDRVVSELA